MMTSRTREEKKDKKKKKDKKEEKKEEEVEEIEEKKEEKVKKVKKVEKKEELKVESKQETVEQKVEQKSSKKSSIVEQTQVEEKSSRKSSIVEQKEQGEEKKSAKKASIVEQKQQVEEEQAQKVQLKKVEQKVEQKTVEEKKDVKKTIEEKPEAKKVENMDKKPKKPSIVEPEQKAEPPKIEISDAKKGLHPPGATSRRGSLIPPEDAGGRRPSLINADECKKLKPGEIAGDNAKASKLKPGDATSGSSVTEVKGRRRSSTDRRGSTAGDKEELMDKASTPLKATGAPGPPAIVDVQLKYNAVEDQNGYIDLVVEGNPAPKAKFTKGIMEIVESGRYKIHTDGVTNTITLCIRKSKANDEGVYKVVVSNEHGQDSAEMELYVSDASGMDFRSMLKKKRYAKWKREQDKEEVDLKEVEKPAPPTLKKVERKQESWIKPLIDSTVKEIKDKTAKFEGEFSKKDSKPKWFHKKDEIFNDSRHKLKSEGCVHTLVITKPAQDDMGRYSVECMGISCSAVLTVEEPDPDYKFVRTLAKKSHGYTTKDIDLEAQTSSHKAIVHWFKGDEKLEDNDKYKIYKDMTGTVRLTIRNAKKEDKGKYNAKIFRCPKEVTETTLKVEDLPFKFTKQLKSRTVIENSKVVLDCEVDEAEAKVVWYLGDKKIEPDAQDEIHYMFEDKSVKMIVDGRKRSLVFKKINMKDANNYTCKTNSDQTTCELMVDYENMFKKPLQDTTVFERTDAVFEIEITDPKATVEFYHRGTKVTQCETTIVENVGKGVFRLTFKNCTIEEDEGEIKAVSGSIECTCQLTVGEGEKPPVIKPNEPIEGPVTRPLTFEVPYTVPGPSRLSKVDAKLLKDGKPLSVPKDVEISVQEKCVVYTIKKPSRADTGKWTIKMSNAAGHSTKDVRINMQDKPSPPTSLEVSEIFSSHCTLSFAPPKDDGGMQLTYYTIEKQDFSLKGGWSMVAEVPADEPLKVKCEGLENKKQYKFRVTASNKLGASEPAMLRETVLAKDPWDEPGKCSHIEVTDWGPEFADLRWSRPETDGGSPITGYVIEYRDRFTDWKTCQEIQGDVLEGTVPDLTEGSQYEFRVRAVNKAGPGEPSDPTQPICAKHRFLKPFIKNPEEFKNVVIKKEKQFALDIKFGGEPEPKAIWKFEDKEILEEESESLGAPYNCKRITIDSYERNTVMTIRKGVRKDTGHYKLTLINSVGECSEICDVVVLGKPARPEGPLFPEEVRDKHVKLKWRKPKDDGGLPIEGYIIEKMDMDSGVWEPCGEVSAPAREEFTADRLTPGKKYKFRVKAINREGESEPLENDEPILARNPYDE